MLDYIVKDSVIKLYIRESNKGNKIMVILHWILIAFFTF